MVEGHEAGDSAFSVGAALGTYIEPFPVHVGIGYGGDLLATQHRGYGPPALQIHDVVGLTGRLEVAMAHFDETGTSGLWATGAFTWTRRDDVVEVDFVDGPDMVQAGWGWSGFAGAAAKWWFGIAGVRVSLGPAYLATYADGWGRSGALGAQLRLGFFGAPDFGRLTVMGNLFRHGYDVREAQQRFNRDQQQFHQRMDQTRDLHRHQTQPRCQSGQTSGCRRDK